MEGAVVINVVRAKDDVLDGGHQRIEAEGLAVVEVYPYQP